MEDRRQYCEKLIKKWREFEEKSPKIQKITDGEFSKNDYISPEEFEEHRETVKKLKEECLEFLSPSERFKINERVELFKSRNTK
jgi:hypothetical protein